MLPPGRRRGAAVSSGTTLLGLFLLFASTATAAGSVLGLDFGTLNLKAALVKPGIPLEIVLSKDSKRKETAALAFKPNRDSKNQILAEPGKFPERVYGGDALALQGRIPGEVFPNLKLLLGLPADGTSDMIATYNSRYPAVRVEQVEELGTVMIKSSAFVKEEPPWSVQELLAMELANVKRNAEALAGKGSSVDDAVITVPAFYTADERRAIENAASLAGLNVNAIITDGLAVGLDYAKSRTFPEVTKGEKPEYHIVYDMGAGSTTATLLRFQGKSVKDIGRYNKTVQEVAVLGTGWDRTLGGESLNQVVVNDFVHKFLTKPVLKSRGTQEDEIKADGRLMSRLSKDAEKARQVLSANTETTSSFEELMPEIDFRVKLTRADFESLTVDFAERVEGPIKDALAAAKLTMKDIDSIIMFGGAVRTPFVQKQLEKVAGGSAKLRSNVNADESAVFGAAFKAAGLSPSFKVKEIRDSDVAGYAAGMMYQDGGKDRKQPIFAVTSRVGSGAATKQVSFKDKEDFAFSVYQTVDGIDRPVIRVQTNNLTAGVKELNTKYGCTAADVSTKFGIKLSAVNGLPEVVSGTVSCEVEGSAKSGSVMDTAKDWLGLGKKDQEPLGVEDDGPTEEVKAGTSSASKSKSSSTSSSGSSSSSSKVPEKPKKRTESINVAFIVTPQGNPQPAPEELKRMRDRLAAFDKSDHARLDREEALNVLESYTYQVRDFLSNSDYSLVGTDAMRDEISKLLDTTRSFMESPSDVAKATEQVLREKLSGLKKLVEPVKSRRTEETARPEKVAALRESLDQTGKFVEMVREQVDKAATASSKASIIEASKSAEAAAKSAAAPAESSAASDDFDNLEEPDTSSTSTSDAPKYSNPADFSPYSSVDLADLESVYEKVGTWLSEKEAEQAKLKSHEDPVLLVKDIETQASKLSQVMRDLLSKKMRQQQQSKTTSSSKKPASSKSSKTKSSKKSAKSSASTADGAEESASGTKSAKPAFVTINPGDDMPTEEEIMRMVNEAKDQGAETKAAKSKHDEL
ncbi:lumenal Hsp70 protein [Elasticomyces elasticus]|uniref:Lumenal Hsp70 protein n=1 Tax=Elasticomyces elasticus TaxID=574655 RepID=A0AAN8A5Q6_9PEZI|nr:lumenal Hsp70 protein [Elasticomyces elasticus]